MLAAFVNVSFFCFYSVFAPYAHSENVFTMLVHYRYNHLKYTQLNNRFKTKEKEIVRNVMVLNTRTTIQC